MGIAESWVKILYTYGPFAILVFLVFITERKSRTAMAQAAPGEKKTFIAIYILNWVAIFGLVIFSVYAWVQTNLESEPTIRGRIENLSNQESVETNADNFYLRRKYINVSRSDYEWLLVNPKRLPDGYPISIVLDPNTGEASITNYVLTVKSDFYDKDVRIVYDRGANKMFVDDGDKREELPQSKSSLIAAQPKPKMEFFTTVAHAQNQPSFSAIDFTNSLQSPDAVVRRNARADLAKQGAAALPWIESILYDRNSSYRLKLGVIVALNNMPNLRANTLKPSTITAIRNASSDPDDALRNEANAFLQKYGDALTGNSSAIVTVYESVNYGGRAQDFGLGEYRWDKGQFGSLPNDSASSVSVMKGYEVRLCDNADGTGACEEIGEGPHRLKVVAGQVSYINVFKASPPSKTRRARR